MLLILIAIFVLACFFPFLWFLFFGLIVYLVFTAKNRRIKIMRREIVRLFEAKNESTVETKIRYSVARKYALDCGAEENLSRSMLFTIELNAMPYLITIHEESDGTTGLRVQNKEDYDRVMNDIARDFNGAMSNFFGDKPNRDLGGLPLNQYSNLPKY